MNNEETETLIELVDRVLAENKFNVGYFAEELNRQAYDRWRNEGN